MRRTAWRLLALIEPTASIHVTRRSPVV